MKVDFGLNLENINVLELKFPYYAGNFENSELRFYTEQIPYYKNK